MAGCQRSPLNAALKALVLPQRWLNTSKYPPIPVYGKRPLCKLCYLQLPSQPVGQPQSLAAFMAVICTAHYVTPRLVLYDDSTHQSCMLNQISLSNGLVLCFGRFRRKAHHAPTLLIL